MAFCCVVYVSEAASLRVINGLRAFIAASTTDKSSTQLAHVFADDVYNRTSFYFIGRDTNSMVNTVKSCCIEAYKHIPFSQCAGTHPTLGSVDHVVFSPLMETSTDQLNDKNELINASTMADMFAREITEIEHVPTFRYDTHKPLREIRKALGYFDKDAIAQCNWSEQLNNKIRRGDIKIEPDYGSMHAEEDIVKDKGVMCVGSIPLVLNLNIRFRQGDLKKNVMQITQHVRIPNIVEALTLQHQGGAYEVACNLKRYTSSLGSVDSVLQKAREKVEEMGGCIQIEDAYTTGPTAQELLSKLPPR